jgi:hypothetical protein
MSEDYHSDSDFIVHDVDEELRVANEINDPIIKEIIFSSIEKRPEKIHIEYRVMNERPQNLGASMFNRSEWSTLSEDSGLPTHVFIKVCNSTKIQKFEKKLKALIEKHYPTDYEILALKRLHRDSSGALIEEYLDDDVLAEYPLRNKQTVAVYLLLHCLKRKV